MTITLLLFYIMSLKIILLKLLPHLPGINGLIDLRACRCFLNNSQNTYKHMQCRELNWLEHGSRRHEGNHLRLGRGWRFRGDFFHSHVALVCEVHRCLQNGRRRRQTNDFILQKQFFYQLISISARAWCFQNFSLTWLARILYFSIQITCSLEENTAQINLPDWQFYLSQAIRQWDLASFGKPEPYG